MELLQGARSKLEARQIQQSLRQLQFRILPLSEAIGAAAAALIEQHALAHGIQLADALIAATAIESGLPLCTGNAKQFPSHPRPVLCSVSRITRTILSLSRAPRRVRGKVLDLAGPVHLRRLVDHQPLAARRMPPPLPRLLQPAGWFVEGGAATKNYRESRRSGHHAHCWHSLSCAGKPRQREGLGW